MTDETPTSPPRKFWKWGFKALAALVVGAVVGFGLLHSSPGERLISHLTAKTGYARLEGLDLSWPFNVRLKRLILLDDQGQYAVGEDVVLGWRPFSLLAARLVVDEISASQITIQRLPEFPPGPEQSDTSSSDVPPITGIRLIRLDVPVRLEIDLPGGQMDVHLTGALDIGRQSGPVQFRAELDDQSYFEVTGQAGLKQSDLRWALALKDLARFQALAQTPLSGQLNGSGTISGPWQKAEVIGEITSPQMEVSGTGWRDLISTLRVVPKGNGWDVAFDARLDQLAQGDLLLSPRVTLATNALIDPKAKRVEIMRVRADGLGLNIGGSGVLNEWGRDAHLRLDARAVDLSELPLFPLAGRASLQAVIDGDLTNPDFNIDLGLRGQELGGQGTEALGDRFQLAAKTRIVGNGAFVDSLQLTSPNANLHGRGWLAPDRIDLWVSGNLQSLAPMAQDMAGKAGFGLRVLGRTPSPDIMGSLTITDFTSGNSPKGSGAVVFGISDVVDRPNGGVDVNMTLAGNRITGGAKIASPKAGHVIVSDLELKSGKSVIRGEIDRNDGLVAGRITGDIPSLRPWRQLLGALDGAIRFQLDMDPAQDQSMALKLDVSRFSRDGLRLNRLSVNGRAKGVNSNPDLDLALNLQGLSGPLRLDQVTANIKGPKSQMVVDGLARGQINARVNGVIQMQDQGENLARFNRLDLSANGQSINLAAPMLVKWHQDNVELERLLMVANGGQISASGSYGPSGISGDVSLVNLSLEVVRLFAPDLGVRGLANGNARISGKLLDPAGEAQINLSGLTIPQAGLEGSIDASAQAVLRQGNLDGQLRIGATGVEVAGDFGLGLRSFAPDPARPLRLDAQVRANLEQAFLLYPVPGHRVQGQLDAQISARGALDQPDISANGQLTGGLYENAEFGTLLTNLSAQIGVYERRLRLSAQGNDGTNGSVNATILLGVAEGINIDAQFNNFTAVSRDDYEAQISGPLAVIVQDGQGRIEGQLAIPRAEIDISKLKGSGPKVLDVVEINRPGISKEKEQKDQAKAAAKAGSPVLLDLGLRVRVEKAFVRGMGVESEWNGRIDVRGNTEKPQLVGQLNVVRGRVEMLGRRFELSNQSQVVFVGDADPRLNVIAQSDATDITAEIAVTGTASAPSIELQSQPALPKDEILSRILFGKGAGELTAVQQLQLAQMAAQGLTGRAAFDPLGNVRDVLGLDSLGVGEDSAGGPALSAGKYLRPGTYLRVDQGAQGVGTVTIEQDLRGGFSAETSFGAQQGAGVGLNWRKDY